MSGADFLEVGLDIQEWELKDYEIPSYLLADEEEDEVEESKNEDGDEKELKSTIQPSSCDDDNSRRMRRRELDSFLRGTLPWPSLKEFESNWSFVDEKNGYVPLSYGIIIIWAILVVIKCRKSRR